MNAAPPPVPGSASPSPFASTAWALGGIAALWLVVLTLHLTPVLFAGLLTFAASRSLAWRLERVHPGLRHAQAWELLLAMLKLEALFGLAGLVSAPVIYAQLKHMLQERGLV
jgi:predicted PurR-regulated permease PerM